MKRFWLVLLLLIPGMAFAQTGALNGFCNRGGISAVTSGMKSTNTPQQVIVSCTITVYLTGTTNKATIYADKAGTPLGNPFTSNAAGSNTPGAWAFWAATNTAYDVVASGGIAPNTYPLPATLCLSCYTSSIFSVATNSTANISQSGLNFVDTPSVKFTNPSGVVESANVQLGSILEMEVIAPTGGQYAIVYPSSCAISHQTSNVTGAGICATNNNGGILTVNGAGPVVPADTTLTWGFSLPSYIAQGNITAVYGFSISSMSGVATVTQPIQCGGVNNGPTPQNWVMQQGTAIISPVPTVASTTCSTRLQQSCGGVSGCKGGSAENVAAVGLFIYYTGSAPPTDTNLQIVPPLTYNPNQLSIIAPYDFAMDTWDTNNYYVTLPAYSNYGGQVTMPGGMRVLLMVSHNNNSSSVTINVNGQGTYPVVKSGGASLVSGDITNGAVAELIFNPMATQFELQNPQSPGSGGGLSGMTAGQVPIAATATTVTSSKALAGSGSGITTGPTSSTSGDCVQFTGTAGQIADTGSACGSGSSGPLFGGYVYVTETSTTTQTTPALSTVTSGDLLIIVCRSGPGITYTASSSPSETWNGLTIPSGGISQMFWAKASTTASHTFTCNASGSGSMSTTASDFSGTLGTVNTSGSWQGSSSNFFVIPSGTLTTSQRTLSVLCDSLNGVGSLVWPEILNGSTIVTWAGGASAGPELLGSDNFCYYGIHSSAGAGLGFVEESQPTAYTHTVYQLEVNY